MKITLASIQYDVVEIDFQKVFDFMKNKHKLDNTIYAYITQFEENSDYYLKYVFGIVISHQDMEDYDYNELDGNKVYPCAMNEYLLANLDDSYYEWLEENKERLGLIDD